MSKYQVDDITDAAGTGAPGFSQGIKADTIKIEDTDNAASEHAQLSSTPVGSLILAADPDNTGADTSIQFKIDNTIQALLSTSTFTLTSTDIQMTQTNKLILDDDSDSYIYASADDTIKLYTAGNEAQVWNVSGNSGLGTSTPGARYEVKSTDGTSTPAMRVRKTNSGSTQEFVDFYRNDTTFSGSIRLSATNLLIDNTSDERLKTNIQEITNGLNIVDSLRSVTFDWKDHPEDCPNDIKGFIAQETETVLPHSVTTRDDDLGTKTMSQHEMIPVLWSAVRELSKKLKDAGL
jgi:hypothetical protein